MTFRPVKLGQFQPPTSTSPIDCVPDVVALLINRATVDALRPDHTDIRKASGVPASRNPPGLYYSEGAAAALKWTKSKGRPIRLTPIYQINRVQLRALLKAGRALGISIDTAVTRNTSRRTNFYVGGHTVFAPYAIETWPKGDRCNCELEASYRHDEILVEDPGTTSVGYLLWSADLLFRAAERRGGGAINVIAAPDTEGAEWTTTMTGRFRAAPSTTAKDLGPIVVGRDLAGGRTENGGDWKRTDGTTADGWVHVKRATKWVWVRGEAVA